jgi:hypothetical protein
MGRGHFNYNNAGGYFEHLDGTRKVWRSDAAPAFLLPPANTLTASLSLAYPNFGPTGSAMWYGVVGSTYGNGYFEVIKAGEWGPLGSGIYYLARTYVGAVPAGCNYLDVAAVFTHTSPAPGDYQHIGQFFFVDIVDYQKPGQVTHLDGGFAPLEGVQGWRRAMAVVVDPDGSVWVERYQSVQANAGAAASMGFSVKTGAQVYTGGATGPWNNFMTVDPDPSGWISALTGGGSTNVNGMRGGSSQPAPLAGYETDFRSTWAVALTIRPGYAHT